MDGAQFRRQQGSWAGLLIIPHFSISGVPTVLAKSLVVAATAVIGLDGKWLSHYC